MTKIQNPKPVLVIYYWNLRFVCNLVLGVWDFIDSITPADSRISSRSILQTIDCKFQSVPLPLRARSQKL